MFGQTYHRGLSFVQMETQFLSECTIVDLYCLDIVGVAFETIALLPGNSVIVDNFNIFVYVFERQTGTYVEYRRVDSLFLFGPQDRVCEIRLNENKHYEVKFGDNITGRQLQGGDLIALYFLQSDGVDGQINAV